MDSENMDERSFIEAVQAAERKAEPVPLPGRVLRHQESVSGGGVLEQEGQVVGETISDGNQSILPTAIDGGFDVHDSTFVYAFRSQRDFDQSKGLSLA